MKRRTERHSEQNSPPNIRTSEQTEKAKEADRTNQDRDNRPAEERTTPQPAERNAPAPSKHRLTLLTPPQENTPNITTVCIFDRPTE